jgi:hypothetical protein
VTDSIFSVAIVYIFLKVRARAHVVAMLLGGHHTL